MKILLFISLSSPAGNYVLGKKITASLPSGDIQEMYA